MLKNLQRQAYKLIYLQIGVVLIIAVIWTVISGKQNFWSVILGGISWIIPSLYFVIKVFKLPSKDYYYAILRNFLFGEVGKFLLSAILMVLILKFYSVQLLPFLSGYIGAVLASFLMPFFYGSNESG